MATPEKLGRPKKSAVKSAVKKLPDGRVAPGRGPAKGAPNAGRPPEEWRERLRAMASREEVLEHVANVLLVGPEHPYFDKALDYATQYGYGKPKQEIEHGGKVTLEHLLARSHEL
jgi:hypothetical protein